MNNSGSTVDDLVEIDDDYRPSDDEVYMNPKQEAYFRKKLQMWRDEILRGSDETLKQLKEQDTRLPDATDWASAEIQRSFELRTRDRERKLLSKSRRHCAGSRTAPTAIVRKPRSRSGSAGWKLDRSPPLRSKRKKGTSVGNGPTARSDFNHRHFLPSKNCPDRSGTRVAVAPTADTMPTGVSLNGIMQGIGP